MILPADIKVRSFLGADAVSFSEIGTLARCEQAWVYGYATEREDTKPSAAMQLGTDTHALWGQWHMNGTLDVALPEGWDDNWSGRMTDEQAAAVKQKASTDTALWLMERYAVQYGADGIRAIDVEVPLAAKLPVGPYFFGYADALIPYKRKLWVAELKTTAQLSNVDHLAASLQTRLYVWAARQMGIPVAGALLDVIRSYRPVRKELPLADSFERRWLPYTDAQLVPAVAEAMSAVQVRKQLQGLGEYPRVPLRNVGSACSWCSHQAVCFGLDVEIADESAPL